MQFTGLVAEQTQLNEFNAIQQRLYQPIQDKLEAVKASLKQIMTPQADLLAKSIDQSLGNSGKMLRPLLTLLVSGATGAVEQPHVETAAVAELIHVATLLHDDVLDESNIRRGRSTIRAEWGNKVSILSGDYLLAQASLKLSRLNNCRLVAIFAEVLAYLCEGEVEQIRTSFQIKTDWDSYFNKSICKTASLFSACCESAGVLNECQETEIDQLKTFGQCFGIAFQIVDDLLDYTGNTEKLGKPVFDDLKNGLLNAPVLLALESTQSDYQQYQLLSETIEALFIDKYADETLENQLRSFLKQTDALEKTKLLARSYAQQAIDALSFIADNDFKSALVLLVDYSISRDM